MKKLRFFINFEKEEKWLNDMSKQGWELDKKLFKYEFHKIAPKDTTIKIDYRDFKTNDDFENYRNLFSDFGWQHIAGTKASGKQYFKKAKENGDTDIFSDVSSKAARYKKLSNMWLSIAISYIPIFIALIITNTIDAAAFFNPKLLFLTPGLWEKTGVHFWKALIFETPFAIMRGLLWASFPTVIILNIIFAAKAKKYYRESNLEH